MSELPASGDPFALAYAKGGNAAQAARAEADRLKQADEDVRREQNRYKGYGISTPGTGCPPTPDEALVECVRALQGILADTIQLYKKVPWTEPPFRARQRCAHAQAVLSTDAATNAATNAAGALLQAANTIPGTPTFTPPLLEMTAATAFLPLFTIAPPQGFMVRVSSWGVSFGPSGPKSVILRVRGSTVAGASPAPPEPAISSHQANQQQDAFVVLHPKQTVVVEGRLRDVAAGPVLVDFGVCFWSWPVNRRVDSEEGAILRSGYGVDCP